MAPTFPDEPTAQKPRLVWHWYDLICPFCYVGQDRSAVLERQGLEVADLGFEIHPETPAAGRYVGPRHGPIFAAVEWVRREQPVRARLLRAALFRAYFAELARTSRSSPRRSERTRAQAGARQNVCRTCECRVGRFHSGDRGLPGN